MITIKYKMANGEVIDVEVKDKVAETMQDFKREENKLRMRRCRHEDKFSLDQRKEQGEQFIDISVDIEDFVLEKVEFQEKNKEIHNALNCLSKEQQKLVKLIYFEECSQRDVAHILGVTQAAVSQRIITILKKIKNNIKNF